MKKKSLTTKLDEFKCKYCYGKRYYTVIFGFHGAEDFGGDGFDMAPKIHHVACPRCNRNNRRKIKDVRRTMFYK